MTEKRSLTLLILLMVGSASMFIIIWGIQSMAFIVNPILLAMVITISLLPLVRWFRTKGVSDMLSLGLTVLIVVGVLAIVLGLVFFSMAQLSAEIAVPDLSGSTSTSPSLDSNPGTAITIETLTALMDARGRQQAVSAILESFLVIGFQGLASVAVALIIFIFMLASAVSLPNRMRSGLSIANEYWDRLNQLTIDVQRYVSVMTTINFLVGLGNAVFLWMMGLEYALLWGILAWMMGYIPTIGFWIALIPPVLLAWATLGTQEAIIIFFAYVLINGSVQNFIQPRMMGNQLKISPLIILISLFFWGGLLGAIGAVLSVPLTLIILTFLDSFEATRWAVGIVRNSDETESSKAEREAGLNNVRSWMTRAKTAVTGKNDINNDDNSVD